MDSQTQLPTPSTPSDLAPEGIQAAAADAALLEQLEKDYKRLKQQKARKTGGVEGRVLLNLAFVGGEQHVSYKNQGLYSDPQDANKLYLTFNIVGPQVMKLIGRISSISIPYKSRPNTTDAKAIKDAEVIDRVIQALDEKLDQVSRVWEIVWWMAVGGTCIVHTPWIPNASTELAPVRGQDGFLQFTVKSGPPGVEPTVISEQDREFAIKQGMPPEMFELLEEPQAQGDVGCEVLSPLQVFVDQSVRDLQSLAPDQWVHIASIKTTGWVQENFDKVVEGDKDIDIISSKFHQLGDTTGGIFLKDLIPMVQGSTGEGDPAIVLVVKSYAPMSKSFPKGRYVCWVPGKMILHNEDNPYEEIPLVDFHWSPVTLSFWTSDYVTNLIAPQRFLNKRMSQMGEQANNAIYTPLLLAPGMKAEDIPTDYPGVVTDGLDDSGAPRVERMSPPELPSWFMLSLDKTMALFNNVAGAPDLMQEQKFPGQIRGPMAVPMLQEILDTAWGPLYQHIGERMARVQQQRLNRVKQFYPPQRTLHYTGRNQKDEVLEFHTDEILRAGTNYSVSVERGSLVPEFRALREARVRERLESSLAILYMDEHTGRLDKSKIAADLEFGDAGRESREAQERKFALELIEMLWQGQQVPPPLPFQDHGIMMDELRSAMLTTEWLRASPPIKQAFLERWNMHQQFAAQEAQAQQAALQNQMVQGAVAQATQQAAAKAASMAVESALGQVSAQASAEPGPEALVRSEMEQRRAEIQARPGAGGPSRGPTRPGPALEATRRGPRPA